MIWFTGDTHFWHRKIILYQPTRRVFSTIEEMNEKLITNWNSVVGDSDVVYHVGDFCFAGAEKTASILSALKGQKHLIRGNHDEKKIRGFDSVQDYLELKVHRQLIVLFHYPIYTWRNSHHGSWHLHGHSHGSTRPIGRRLDVGVDCCGMMPISYEQVEIAMGTKEVVLTDYHGRV